MKEQPLKSLRENHFPSKAKNPTIRLRGSVEPEATGRPAYHPATLLKIYVYGYLNRVQSSRRLERECQRNIELV